jgi:RHS repeat-associated protein
MRRQLLKTAAILLGVLTPALPLPAQQNANLEQGLKPFGLYQGGDLDSVSMTNGNLTLHIPLVSYPQRGGKLRLDFFIRYNNKGWHVEEYIDGSGIERQKWDWGGSGVEVVRDQKVRVKTTIVRGTNWYGEPYMANLKDAITADGSSHQLEGTSVDATGITLSGGPIDRAGVRYTSTSVDINVEDPNGNKITTSTSGWTDTLGRLIPGSTASTGTYGLNREPGLVPGVATTDFTSCPSGTVAARTWNLPGPSGLSTIKLCYAALTLTPSFGIPNILEPSITDRFLMAIVLPNQTKWLFQYNSFGDLTQITIPTGGTITYGWGTANMCLIGSNLTPVNRAVISRTVNPNDGSGPRTWTYSWGSGTVTDPAGNDTLHYRSAVVGICSSYVVKTEYYQGTGPNRTLLKTMETTYDGDPNPREVYTSDGTAINVVATHTKTTWASGQVAEQTSTYDSGYTFEFWNAFSEVMETHDLVYGSVMETTESDYGGGAPGPILRNTVNDWLWMSDANYRSRNLLDLASSTAIQDGGGAQFARTEYSYDETAPVSSGITTQRNATPSGSCTANPGQCRGNPTSVRRWLNPPGTLLTSTNKYFDTGTVQEAKDPLLHATTYEYSPTFAGAYVTKITNPLGQFSTFNYNFNSGLQTSATDPNNQTTTSAYDNMFRLTQSNAPDGGQVTFAYTSTAPFKVTVTSKITASMNIVSEGEVDGLGRVKQTRLLSDPQGTVFTDTYYDGNGRVWKVTNPYRSTQDPTYGVTETQYDALGRVTAVVSQSGGFVTSTYDGNSTTVTDQAGKQRRSFTDGLGRLVQVDEPGPGTGTPASPGMGSVTINGTEQSVTEWVYLGEECTEWITPTQCLSWEPVYGWQTTWDSGGVSITVNGFTKSAGYGYGTTGATIAAALADAFGADPASPVTALSGGNVVYLISKATGAASNYSFSATSWTNDPAHFSAPSFTPVPSGPALEGGAEGSAGWLVNPAVTLYTYDALDNLTCVWQKSTDTSPNPQTCLGAPTSWRPRQFAYDSLSRLASAYNPESGTIAYTYDNDGNLISKTDARGITTTFGYDPLHRLTAKTYSDTTPAATFTFDLALVDGLSITNPVGRLVKAATSNTRTVNSYDVMGRISAQWQCTPATCGTSWFSASYAYNLASAVTSQSNPVGFTLTQTYNAAARLTGLTSSWSDAQHPAALFTADPAQGYHAHGALKLATLGNGLAESTAYNNRLQPTEMRSYDPSSQQDKLKLTYGFTDAQGRNNGNVMSWAATGAQVFSRTYAYDELNRIASMASPGETCVGLGWTYDIWANRTNQNGAGGSCQEHHPTVLSNNRIAELGYDAAGNTTSNGATTYQYDAENRMVSLNGGGGSNPEYVYDANGRRVRKKIGSTLTEFIYDVAGSVMAERESTDGGANWTWAKGYVYVNGQILAQYNGVLGTSGATTLFAHKDHLGSTRLQTKPDKSYDPGDVYDYLPFGESTSSGSTTHKFTGKERDGESSLDFFNARYYSSSLGRFLSPDPDNAGSLEEDPQRWNGYSYARNNPLLYTDPDGTDVRICIDGQDECFTLTDQQYKDLLKEQQGKQGITLPEGQFPSGDILCGGQKCGTAQYFEPGLADDYVIPAVVGAVAGAVRAGVRGLLSAGAGNAGKEAAAGAAAGAASGAGRGTGQVLIQGTKAAVREALESGVVNSAQRAVIKRELQRGAANARYAIEKFADGSVRVIREVPGRAGGRATYEKVVNSAGETVRGSVIQKGYDAGGNLVHIDVKY